MTWIINTYLKRIRAIFLMWKYLCLIETYFRHKNVHKQHYHLGYEAMQCIQSKISPLFSGLNNQLSKILPIKTTHVRTLLQDGLIENTIYMFPLWDRAFILTFHSGSNSSDLCTRISIEFCDKENFPWGHISAMLMARQDHTAGTEAVESHLQANPET
jgi:hypothetical protein